MNGSCCHYSWNSLVLQWWWNLHEVSKFSVGVQKKWGKHVLVSIRKSERRLPSVQCALMNDDGGCSSDLLNKVEWSSLESNLIKKQDTDVKSQMSLRAISTLVYFSTFWNLLLTMLAISLSDLWYQCFLLLVQLRGDHSNLFSCCLPQLCHSLGMYHLYEWQNLMLVSFHPIYHMRED